MLKDSSPVDDGKHSRGNSRGVRSRSTWFRPLKSVYIGRYISEEKNNFILKKWPCKCRPPLQKKKLSCETKLTFYKLSYLKISITRSIATSTWRCGLRRPRSLFFFESKIWLENLFFFFFRIFKKRSWNCIRFFDKWSLRCNLTPVLYCLGPRVAEPKKWFFPNFIFKGWEWCIWTITTIIHHQIWSADSTADITVIQSSKLSTLRSTFGRVPVNFFNCSGWNSFNFYMNFWQFFNFGWLQCWLLSQLIKSDDE